MDKLLVALSQGSGARCRKSFTRSGGRYGPPGVGQGDTLAETPGLGKCDFRPGPWTAPGNGCGPFPGMLQSVKFFTEKKLPFFGTHP
jgi:hypothetical protein